LRVVHPTEHDAERAFADIFVEQILAEARWAKSERHAQRSEITRTELRAERDDLLKLLVDVERKLRTLSPDVDRLLGADADPLGVADAIKVLLTRVDRAASDPDPRTPASPEKARAVMLELTIRILRVLRRFAVRSSGSGSAYFEEYTPDATRIIKAIGDDMGLVRALLTWRDVVIKALRYLDLADKQLLVGLIGRCDREGAFVPAADPYGFLKKTTGLPAEIDEKRCATLLQQLLSEGSIFRRKPTT
jgi:hypothetical protein